jgi:hypothetical protein
MSGKQKRKTQVMPNGPHYKSLDEISHFQMRYDNGKILSKD